MKRDRPREDQQDGGGRYCEEIAAVKPSRSKNEEVDSYAKVSSSPSLIGVRTNDYSTFSSPIISGKASTSSFILRKSPYQTLYDCLSDLTRRIKGSSDPCYLPKAIEHNHHNMAISTWRTIMLVSLAIAIVAYLNANRVDQKYNNFMPAEWHWDHNVYIPKDGGEPIVTHMPAPVALIAQVVPGAALGHLEDVSSRPNRAYARQWGLDFARYDAGHSSYSPRACFEKVAVLNAILDRQSNNTGEIISLWPHYPRVQYDSILLLPPDAILTELDTNIIDDILPHNKLVAIAGWSRHNKLNSNSDVIAFNLKHRYAEAVARLWLEMATPTQVTCGDNNDLGMLVTAIATVMNDTEDLDDLIEPLPESDDGFIGNRIIKSIPSSVPGPRTALLFNSLQESATILQETADSVCYRFYPKCEVMTAN